MLCFIYVHRNVLITWKNDYVKTKNETIILQSIILPVHNADKWLDECLHSVADQSYSGGLELSLYKDSCTVSLLYYNIFSFVLFGFL